MEELQTPHLTKTPPSPARDCTHRAVLLTALTQISRFPHQAPSSHGNLSTLFTLEDSVSNGFLKHKSAGNHPPVTKPWPQSHASHSLSAINLDILTK